MHGSKKLKVILAEATVTIAQGKHIAAKAVELGISFISRAEGDTVRIRVDTSHWSWLQQQLA